MKARLAAGLLFSAAFLVQYHFLTAPLYGYWGFSGISVWECLWLLPLMALPALSLPERLDRPSALFALLNYAVLYAPLCVLLFHSTKTELPAARLWAVWAGFALATVVLGWVSGWTAPSWRGPALSRGVVLAGAWALAVFALLAALSASHFHWVNLAHTAVARTSYSADVAALGPWFGYIDAWAALACVPFLLSESLRKAAWFPCLLLCALCALAFLLSGRKTDLFCPVAVAALHLTLKGRFRVSALLGCLAVLLVLPFGLEALGLVRAVGLYANVFNFRVFAVPQILVPQYDAYYAAHGLTFFRPVGLVNRLLFHGAPFEQPYLAISSFYYHAHFTADAMPYASDGLAALGLAGLPLVTALLAGLFWVLDGLTRRHAPLLVLPALAPFLFSLCNNSLFTSLLTGGGFALMLLFACLPDTA